MAIGPSSTGAATTNFRSGQAGRTQYCCGWRPCCAARRRRRRRQRCRRGSWRWTCAHTHRHRHTGTDTDTQAQTHIPSLSLCLCVSLSLAVLTLSLHSLAVSLFLLSLSLSLSPFRLSLSLFLSLRPSLPRSHPLHPSSPLPPSLAPPLQHSIFLECAPFIPLPHSIVATTIKLILLIVITIAALLRPSASPRVATPTTNENPIKKTISHFHKENPCENYDEILPYPLAPPGGCAVAALCVVHPRSRPLLFVRPFSSRRFCAASDDSREQWTRQCHRHPSSSLSRRGVTRLTKTGT